MENNKITKVIAVFFSATETTKKVTTRIAGEVARCIGADAAQFDFTLPGNRVNDINFPDNALVIFGVPTYAGRVPNVLLPYLNEKIHGNKTLAVPVVLYGNRNFDDSLIELRNTLESNNFRTVAAAGFIGEHSFSYKLAAGRPDNNDLLKADEFAAKIVDLIVSGEERIKSSVQVRGEEPIRPYYIPRDRNGESINILKVRPEVSSECVDCKICAEVCPMGSIDHENIRKYTGICIKCGACVKKCPKRARYYTDGGYLYHMTELEEMYEKRKEPEFFGVGL